MFTGAHGDGGNPWAGVVTGPNNSLIGTTYFGGGNVGACGSNNSAGCGTVYELSPPPSPGDAWIETRLHSFSNSNNYDAAFPVADPVFGPQGEMYGTSLDGGQLGVGAIYRMRPPAAGSTRWREEVLYSFQGFADGGLPEAALIFGPNRGLYGTTSLYGYNNVPVPGTAFVLSPPGSAAGVWTKTILHTFTGENGDGYGPVGTLTNAPGGVLYGVTYQGGAYGFGAVYQLTQAVGGDWNESIVYSFHGGKDGAWPSGTLALSSGGALYGATSYGGTGACQVQNAPPGCGVVFELAPPLAPGGAWRHSVLHDFSGADGAQPWAGLALDGQGDIYGATAYGGSGPCTLSYAPPGCGTVFELTHAAN